MNKDKSSLEELIQIKAENKYENEDLLNLALAFEENGFKSLLGPEAYLMPSFSGGYQWDRFEGLRDFENKLRDLFPNYDDFKEERLKEIENNITENILDQLSSVEKLLESRED